MPWPKGKPRSPETCKKMSIGMKGKKAWNKGLSPSEETRMRYSKAQTGRVHSEETKQKISEWHRGRPRSAEVREKMSKSRLGKIPWNKGIPCSVEARQKLSIANSGENAPNWQGGKSFEPYCPKFNAGFKERVRETFGRKCFLCSTTETENRRKLGVHHIDYNKNSICNGKEWAFVPLCNKCHFKTNVNRHYYFNMLINYWALNPEFNF